MQQLHSYIYSTPASVCDTATTHTYHNVKDNLNTTNQDTLLIMQACLIISAGLSDRSKTNKITQKQDYIS